MEFDEMLDRMNQRLEKYEPVDDKIAPEAARAFDAWLAYASDAANALYHVSAGFVADPGPQGLLIHR